MRSPFLRVVQFIALAVLGLLGLLVWRVTTSGRGAELVKAIRNDERPEAPQFRLPVTWANGSTWPPSLRSLLQGRALSLSSLRGHPVVLNFWASWCIPRKEEAPRLAAAATASAGTVVFLGVDVQDLRSDARRFLRRYEVRCGSVQDNGGSTYDGYGLTDVPETYWLDARCRIVAHVAGPVSTEQRAARIRTATGGQ